MPCTLPEYFFLGLNLLFLEQKRRRPVFFLQVVSSTSNKLVKHPQKMCHYPSHVGMAHLQRSLRESPGHYVVVRPRRNENPGEINFHHVI